MIIQKNEIVINPSMNNTIHFLNRKKQCKEEELFQVPKESNTTNVINNSQQVNNNTTNNIIPIKLEWKDVCKNETELRDDIDTYINELLYGVSNSDFIGEIGQRLDIEATLIKAKEVESNYGNGHFYVFEDFSGNQMIWTTTARVLEVGVVYKFRGTIKALNEYRGVKQTVLTNCRFSRS